MGMSVVCVNCGSLWVLVWWPCVGFWEHQLLIIVVPWGLGGCVEVGASCGAATACFRSWFISLGWQRDLGGWQELGSSEKAQPASSKPRTREDLALPLHGLPWILETLGSLGCRPQGHAQGRLAPLWVGNHVGKGVYSWMPEKHGAEEIFGC